MKMESLPYETLFNIHNLEKTVNKDLYQAAICGNKNMIDYLHSLGTNNSNEILEGNGELVDYTSTLEVTDLNEALIETASGGHNDIILYLITLGSVSCATAINLDEALLVAIENENFNTVKYLLTQGPQLRQQYPKLTPPTIEELDHALIFVSQSNDIELVQYLISLGTTELSLAIFTALTYDQVELIKYLLTNALSFKIKNPNINLPS